MTGTKPYPQGLRERAVRLVATGAAELRVGLGGDHGGGGSAGDRQGRDVA